MGVLTHGKVCEGVPEEIVERDGLTVEAWCRNVVFLKPFFWTVLQSCESRWCLKFKNA